MSTRGQHTIDGLRALLKRADLSYEKLAQDAGYKGASSVQRYFTEDGLQEDGTLPLRFIRKIAPVLAGRGSPPIQEDEVLSLSGIEPGNITPMKKDIARLTLKGEVQAGAWMEAVEYPEQDQESFPIFVGDMPGTDKMFLLKARGDSMNLANAADGTLLICMGLHDFLEYRDVKSGDRVIAHQYDAGGVEATVKELEIRPDGSHWLWPRSDNPEHQQPIKVPPASEWEDGNGETSIQAVVVGHIALSL